jgi:hypothetical protein
MPFDGRSSHGNNPKTAKTRSTKTNCNSARQLKISFHLREVSLKTVTPFSRSPGPIALNLRDFLRAVGEIAGPVINFDDHSLRQCRVAFVLTPLIRPRLDKSNQRAARRSVG